MFESKFGTTYVKQSVVGRKHPLLIVLCFSSIFVLKQKCVNECSVHFKKSFDTACESSASLSPPLVPSFNKTGQASQNMIETAL